MISTTTTVQVRYCETDAMGVAHHSSYVPWLELARIRFLDTLGVSYKGLEQRGVVMPVVSLKIDYHRPCVFDDLVVIETRVTELPRSRMPVNYTLWLGEATLATAETVLAFVDFKSRRPTRPPEDLLEALTHRLEMA